MVDLLNMNGSGFMAKVLISYVFFSCSYFIYLHTIILFSYVSRPPPPPPAILHRVPSILLSPPPFSSPVKCCLLELCSYFFLSCPWEAFEKDLKMQIGISSESLLRASSLIMIRVASPWLFSCYFLYLLCF